MDFPSPLHIPNISICPPAAASPLDIEGYTAFFHRYADEITTLCPHDPAPMRLKLKHSLLVLEHARFIVSREGFPAQASRACLLAALFHDISRFEQYRIWKTFRDHESCDHGTLSAYLLRSMHVLDHEPDLEKRVLTAVELHNKRFLPTHLSPEERLTANVVRDADRIDIMRVIDEHLSEKTSSDGDVVTPFPDDPGVWSQAVIDAALDRRTADYADIQSVNDFRLLAAAWYYLLDSPSARELARNCGHARRLVESLPAPYAAARDQLLADLKG